MEKSDYQQLAELMGKQFELVFDRMDVLDRRMDTLENHLEQGLKGLEYSIKDVDHQNRILHEHARADARSIIEAVNNNWERYERDKAVLDNKLHSLDMVDLRQRADIEDLNIRVTSLGKDRAN